MASSNGIIEKCLGKLFKERLSAKRMKIRESTLYSETFRQALRSGMAKNRIIACKGNLDVCDERLHHRRSRAENAVK